MTKQPSTFDASGTFRLGTPSVEAAGMHAHHLAKQPYRVLLGQLLNQGVPYPDSLAKYAAAFLRNSPISC